MELKDQSPPLSHWWFWVLRALRTVWLLSVHRPCFLGTTVYSLCVQGILLSFPWPLTDPFIRRLHVFHSVLRPVCAVGWGGVEWPPCIFVSALKWPTPNLMGSATRKLTLRVQVGTGKVLGSCTTSTFPLDGPSVPSALQE